MTDTAARIIIALAAEPGDEKVGAALAEFGAVESVHRWLREESTTPVAKNIKRVVDSNEVARALASIEAVSGRFVTPHDAEWPQQLNDLDVASPIGLWVCGSDDLRALAQRSLAIVGARASTAYGERIASDLASNCAQSDVCVISGGAYGIDASAHRGAIAEYGKTIAVLACGVDVAYPAAHQALLSRIKERGAVISEAPPGASPHKHRFLTRNRLIAALAQSTVVVEAALRSGALSTSNWALALGRKVWGVPGPLTSATSAGVHQGISEAGFALMCTVHDPLRDFGQSTPKVLMVSELEIQDALSRGHRSTAEIVSLCGKQVDVHQILGTLALMEMRGDIKHVGDMWSRA